ncbi:hypothetical protein PYCCODRAFT_5914 [Trametes coccinea BRFM310]|uniref:Uncharacterized protein n=1 Tax=Trametes coccinea (strain BRFM310) TaxID=1353009 RepID=A0A1Y2J4J1_TRAC3|nr:hypothetical protein PYCCODRAFT_5914 [Trametes coccinea BRFM310]
MLIPPLHGSLSTVCCRPQRSACITSLSLQHRVLRIVPSATPVPELRAICATRDFLRLPRGREREALCLLVFSEHPPAERLRRAPTASPIPRAWHVCRFCSMRAAVEDEPHVLLDCSAPLLCARRDRFVAELTTVQPSMPPLLAQIAPEAALNVLPVSGDSTTGPPLVADYVADVFELGSDLPSSSLPARNNTTRSPRAISPERRVPTGWRERSACMPPWA